MDRMGVIEYHKKSEKEDLNPTPTTIISYLLLPTMDDTQTALAKVNIHLSEAKVKQWRKLAEEKESIEYTTDSSENPKPRSCISQCYRGALLRLQRANLGFKETA